MSDVEICRWIALEARWDQLLGDLERIFFMSSARQSFGSEQERTEFRERWLGRYLTHFTDNTFVALDTEGRAIGYVIGSLDDPAKDPLFADLPFLSDFSALTARYPAQLHVNIDAARRGEKIGARLVDAFSGHAARAGAKGVHVVTARGMRNIGFYGANGFFERGAATASAGHELVFLGRDL